MEKLAESDPLLQSLLESKNESQLLEEPLTFHHSNMNHPETEDLVLQNEGIKIAVLASKSREDSLNDQPR